MDDAQPAHWLEVSLAVDNELAEAVAEVLSRYVANGVVIENDMYYTDAEDIGTPVGTARVYGYLAINELLEQNRQKIEHALWHLGQIQPLPQASFKEIADQDWMTAWKDHYKPIPIGLRLLILPAWMENPYPDRLPVRIDPSMAFGTGTHPSTQLCLHLIENYFQPGQPFIDIGCGSGILSIAALHLGASLAVAVDTDLVAVHATRENAERNGVLDRVETGQGSVGEILEGKYSVKRAPLVVANILAPVIINLLDQGLASLVEPGGVLVLAGILDEQADRVLVAAEKQNLRLVEQRQMADWVALALKAG